MPVAIVGGGTFGQGLALAAARTGRRVLLWSRTARELGHEHIQCTTDLAQLSQAEIMFVAVPSPHINGVADSLCPHVSGAQMMVHVSRGVVGDELTTVSEVLRRRTPCRRVGVLAGPLVAGALAEGAPSGGVVGTLFPEVADAVIEAIGGPKLRVYTTTDVIGVELGAAFVGLVALALGFAMAQKLGPSTLAVLATRGLAEGARVGSIFGANERTFAGLAGAGDLMAAIAGDQRPEVAFGMALANGMAAEQAAQRAGAYVEGVAIARRIAAWADHHEVDVPISTAIAHLIKGEISGEQVVHELMTRPIGTGE